VKDTERSLADQRAEQGAPVEDDESDFADEHTPGPSDPPIAEDETPGGEDDGYQPQTRV
jgi:hypothetical protein